MNCTGTGEIVEAHLADEAAAPDPVTGDRVDHRRYDHGIDAVGRELGAFGHGAGHDGRGGGTEYGLEDQRRPVVAFADHTVRQKVKAAEHAVHRTEHDAKSDQPEDRRTE